MSWEELRRQARYLENEIESKLDELNKLDSCKPVNHLRNDEAGVPLLSNEFSPDDLIVELEKLLEQLTAINSSLRDEYAQNSSTSASLVFQRHSDVLQDYRNEFFRVRDRCVKKQERNRLFEGGSSSFGQGNSGLNRRNEMYMKEHDFLKTSERLIDEQIEITIEGRDALINQREASKRMRSRLADMSSRFPVINNLVQKINLRTRRDAIIVGALIGFCCILLLWYIFY